MDELPSPDIEYREVATHPGFFVGTDGSIWSHWHRYWEPGRHGCAGSKPGAWRRIVPTPNHNGYLLVGMSGRGAPNRIWKVARLVLTVFVGPPPGPEYESAHENGVRDDNRLSNLAWKTKVENAADRKRHGTQAMGETHRDAKLTEDQVREIRRRRAAGETQVSIKRDFPVSRPTLSSICTGRTWKHLPVEEQQP